MTTTDTDLALDERLCFGTYKLNRAFNRFYQKAFSQTGLTYPKFVILLALEEHGPMTLTDLSNRAGVEANSLSPLVKKMSSFGLLHRERLAEDERRVMISITEMGHAALTKARAVVSEGFETLGIDPEKIKEALALFELVGNKLDAADPPKLSLD